MPTLAELETRLAQYRAAEAAVLKSQEYTVSDGAINRRMRRADLSEIRAAIKDLEADIETERTKARPGGRRVLYLRPGA